MPIRLSSSTRRDLSLIACCSLVLLVLVEFRYGLSSVTLGRTDGNHRGVVVSSSAESASPLDALDLEDRELLGHIAASPPSRPKHRSSSSSRLKNHHKHASSSRTKPAAFDTHDNRMGASRVSWGRNEQMPLTDLVGHAPGSYLLLSSCGATSKPVCLRAKISCGVGFTILDNVYFLNGTLYIVRSDTKPGSFPEPRMMISNAGNRTLSIEDNMRIISERDALRLFGTQASRIEGTTVSIGTPAQPNASA